MNELHCQCEGHFPAVIQPREGRSDKCELWPLRVVPWHFHFHDRVCLGKIIPQDPACRGSLCSPTQSTFTHLLLPGTSRRRGVVPPTLPRHHRLLLMCQQTWESSGCPPDRHPHLLRICGPTRGGITCIRERRNYKYEPKQENEARNSKPCSLLWASAHSSLPNYLSTLAATESTSCLLSIQTFPAESEGIQVFSFWL